MRYSKAGLPGSEDSMRMGVKPGPSLCNASSTENTSASTKFNDRFRYGKNSAKTCDSEKDRALRKATWAPISDIRFCVRCSVKTTSYWTKETSHTLNA